MGKKLDSVFNKLSGIDRLKLETAALTKAITGFIRDDTKEHPWRYPAYATYLAAFALPVLGVAAVLGATTAFWARHSKSEYGQRLNSRITEAFNHETLLRDHEAFLESDPENPDLQRVKGSSLAWDTSKKSMTHSWQATKHAWSSAKKFIIG